MINCLFTLAGIVPLITSLADAMISLKQIRRQIEREPFIDVREESGIKLPETGWAPSFALENVIFAYPSRPTIPALNNVSVKSETGTVTAFVGPSGSGKSTLVSLLLREYDPETANIPDKNDAIPADKEGARLPTDIRAPDIPEALVKGAGKVYFAGRDIREYNLRWLRSQLAVVPQNPQLFTGTVFENVAAGLVGTAAEYRPDIDGAADASPNIKKRAIEIRQLCLEAMQKSQAWSFVSRLPRGMDTMISGGRTGVLSGGQGQRLAIARALVRNPTCLLLDEATSALDAETEERIRLVLEREFVERGMTTIIIAHRLSTVAKAGRIIVMKEGRVVDQGRYEDLMDKNRPDQTFRKLANMQRVDHDCTDCDTAGEMMSAGSSAMAEERRLFQPSTGVQTDAKHTTAPCNASSPAVSSRKANFEEEKQNEEKGRRSARVFFKHIVSQKGYFITGGLAGVLAGIPYPIVGWMTGNAVHSLSDVKARPGINSWSLWFLVVAIIDLFSYLLVRISRCHPAGSSILTVFSLNAFYLEVASENILRKLKRDSLRTLIKQEIGFFDQKESSAGSLTSNVSSHPANVAAALELVTAQVIVTLTNVVGSMVLGMIVEWRTTLVCVPAILVLFFSVCRDISVGECGTDSRISA